MTGKEIMLRYEDSLSADALSELCADIEEAISDERERCAKIAEEIREKVFTLKKKALPAKGDEGEKIEREDYVAAVCEIIAKRIRGVE